MDFMKVTVIHMKKMISLLQCSRTNEKLVVANIISEELTEIQRYLIANLILNSDVQILT